MDHLELVRKYWFDLFEWYFTDLDEKIRDGTEDIPLDGDENMKSDHNDEEIGDGLNGDQVVEQEDEERATARLE